MRKIRSNYTGEIIDDFAINFPINLATSTEGQYKISQCFYLCWIYFKLISPTGQIFNSTRFLNDDA